MHTVVTVYEMFMSKVYGNVVGFHPKAIETPRFFEVLIWLGKKLKIRNCERLSMQQLNERKNPNVTYLTQNYAADISQGFNSLQDIDQEQ